MKLKNYVCHSGGAKGSDYKWGIVGKSYGVVTNHYMCKGFTTPYGNSITLKYDNQKGFKLLPSINEKYLNRKFPPRNNYVTSLLVRNYSQVKYADAIYAISTFKDGIVQGGTAWAVYMGIELKKPVYVFDQDKNSWWKYEDKREWDWFEVPTPTLTKDFAGIGTRNLNYNGHKAIIDCYMTTIENL